MLTNTAQRTPQLTLQNWVFVEAMSLYCGKVLKITTILSDYYRTDGNIYCWQDWMLEDDVVETTEEKTDDCEVLKFIKSMKTKEMTKEEIFAYLNNKKILCTSSEESINVQKKLFELGFEWNIPGKTIDELKFLLYIEGKLLKYVLDIDFWVRSLDYKRIEPNEILAIQIKEEKPKFNPSTLQAFDKVLVRDSKNEKWRARFFDLYEDGEFGTTCNCYWKNIIPYNEETKHLVGTADEAPDFYNIW